MADPLEHFATLLPTASPEALFAELHQLCDDTVGVKLFTCSRFHLAAGKAERIFTSDPETYPLTGLKDIVHNRWAKIVLGERQVFLSENIAGLRDVFPDHEKIESLGLGAAVNIPIFVSGVFLGTANLLHSDGVYTQETLRALTPLKHCASLCFYAHMCETEFRPPN